jgi:adenylylsulfate kinase-like enzyme
LTQPQASALEQDIEKARRVLGQRNLVFVGLMGAGKSAIGRLVAQMLEHTLCGFRSRDRAGIPDDDPGTVRSVWRT